MNLTPKMIKTIGWVGGGMLLVFLLISISAGVHNRTVVREENVHTSKSNVSKEEQRRVDVFNNLADAVVSYNKFEEATLEKVIKARQQANSGKVENAHLMLAAVVEQYPQLKSQSNYKQAMTEFSVTENRLANYREQYNNDVRDYNRYVRSFWASIVLAVTGYDKQDFQYLDYKVNNNEARNLFSK